MRVNLVAAVGIVGLLAGCDQLGIGQRAAAPPCHCVAAAPAEPMARLTPPPAHHRHHYAHSYSQAWASGYEEQESSSYTSDSREYDQDEDSSASHESVWVDGYGREHDANAHVTRVAAEPHDRLDPWHAYKSKCGDKDK